MTYWIVGATLALVVLSVLAGEWLRRAAEASERECDRSSVARRLRRWLGADGLGHLRWIRDTHGEGVRLNVCWVEEFPSPEEETVVSRAVRIAQHGRGIPHPVHFREGMQIRNWMRRQPEYADHDAHRLDAQWESLALEAIS